METHRADGKDCDTKVEELMAKTHRTLEEVKSILEMKKLDSESNLYRLLSEIEICLTGVVEKGTSQFKEVGEEEWSKALHKSHRGTLCLKFYRACKENGLNNSLLSITRELNWNIRKLRLQQKKNSYLKERISTLKYNCASLHLL